MKLNVCSTCMCKCTCNYVLSYIYNDYLTKCVFEFYNFTIYTFRITILSTYFENFLNISRKLPLFDRVHEFVSYFFQSSHNSSF